MVIKYRSTRIGPAGYRVGREEVSNRPKPYQRLGHSPIVLHVSAEGLSNRPIHYYRLGHKCTSFYTNWPRLFWPRGNLESAEAISVLGPQSNHFTCVGRDTISNRPGPSGRLSHGDTVLYELAQGYILCRPRGFRIGQSVIIAWSINVPRSTRTGPHRYHVGHQSLSDPPAPYKSLGHNYI